MASPTRTAPLTADMPPPAIKNVRWGPDRDGLASSRSPPSDSEGEADSLRGSDSASVSSTESTPDVCGHKFLTLEDGRDTAVYEAWELKFLKDRRMRQSWKTFCGIPVSTRWVNRNDGCVLVNPITSFEQGELADMHEEAGRKHKQKHKHALGRIGTYEQDLAARVHRLSYDIYDHLQHLIEDKTAATNRNPHRRREWHVVLLQQDQFRVTEQVPKRGGKGLFGRKSSPAADTYFVLLRGREVKSTKEEGGWRDHHERSNPWYRLDSRETREERRQYRERARKMDRRHYRIPRPLPPQANFAPLPRQRYM